MLDGLFGIRGYNQAILPRYTLTSTQYIGLVFVPKLYEKPINHVWASITKSGISDYPIYSITIVDRLHSNEHLSNGDPYYTILFSIIGACLTLALSRHRMYAAYCVHFMHIQLEDETTYM